MRSAQQITVSSGGAPKICRTKPAISLEDNIEVVEWSSDAFHQKLLEMEWKGYESLPSTFIPNRRLVMEKSFFRLLRQIVLLAPIHHMGHSSCLLISP